MAIEINEIPVEASKRYLSDVFDEGYLPYGILDKVIPGCGGTTLALESPFDYIIFVPTIELIENKCNQYNKEDGGKRIKFEGSGSLKGSEYEVEILAIHGNFDSLTEKIDYYISAARKYENPIKIMATYDSAPKLFDYLVDSLIKKCYILVDEFHVLSTDYSYRSKAIENLMEALKNHPKVTYLSATPFKPEHGPIQLEKLPRTIIKWESKFLPCVLLERSKSPLKTVKAIITHDFNKRSIIDMLDENGNRVTPDQYFFFINNIKYIKNIIDDLPESYQKEMRIVCTNDNKNRTILDIHSDLIKPINDLKRYNFLTKRAFNGCDIYSPKGLSIVVSNVYSEVTLLDVNIDILQIAGRIRNDENPFKNILLHIYNERPEDLTQEKIHQLIQKQYTSKIYHTSNIENFNRCFYFRSVIISETYNSLREAYNGIGLQHFEIDLKSHFHQEIMQLYAGRFNVILKEICELYDRGYCRNDLPPELWLFLEDHAIAKEALEAFETETIKTLGFRKKRIHQALEDKKKGNELKSQIAIMLREKISIGETYSRKELKSLLTDIYKILEVKEKAKASHIERYYEVKNTSLLDSEKGTSGAFRIISEKQLSSPDLNPMETESEYDPEIAYSHF